MTHEIPANAIPGFPGRIGRTMAGSEPSWPPGPESPPGAPNIVFVLVDDVGFADIGCFGSEISTPHIDALAREGVQFTNFHVNPMCSPTRASLLTGLNPHNAGMGHIAQDDPGFPGYAAELAEDAVTAAEVLRARGYATFMVGKWHLCRDADMQSTGPKHSWPIQRGFDRYYGILEAFTNLHQPHRLVQDNSVVDIDSYPEDYFLTDDLTERAIGMIRDAAASRPGQPFFLYMAHPAAHAPLHAKADDIDRYARMYDEGWDEIRRRRFERQIELGIVDEGTALPPANPDAGAWADLDDERRQLFARYMAVYAAMVDEIDQSVGRLRQALEETGQWDNTLLVFLSDNGASREGEATGTTNYFAHLAGGPDTVARDAVRLDDIGSARTMPHYPRGWAMAGNTPFRLYKRNTHAGGHQVPCVVSWPRGVRDGALAPGLRAQYGHCIDVLPTALHLAGIAPLAERHGRPARPMNGTSLAGVLADGSHGEVRTEQYYELEGHRGFYRDGWEVVTDHQPRTRFDDDEWELYDLRADPTETTDLATTHPEKVAELSLGFHEAALANQVYPLDEGSGWRWTVRPPKDDVFHEPVTIWPGTPTLERLRSGALVWQRSFAIIISLELSDADRGVLVSHGDQGGGYAVAIDDGRLSFVHNDGHGTTMRVDAGDVAPGHREIVIDFVAPGGGRWDVTYTVDGVPLANGVSVPMLWPIAPFQGISIGRSPGSPVDWQRYERDGSCAFTGRLNWVRYTPGELSSEAPARFTELLREIGSKYE
jgi:arylsulfatase A-like enzyme